MSYRYSSIILALASLVMLSSCSEAIFSESANSGELSRVMLTASVASQVRNVPSRLVYADVLHDADYSGSTLCPANGECQYVDLPIDNICMDGGESQLSFTYYLPRNQRGTTSNTAPASKNTNAPSNATFVEIYGINMSDGSMLRYRLYPGSNTYNDFNITPNCHYTMPLTIQSPHDVAADSRVESFESANCYIVNPKLTKKINYVPVNRVNQFWEHYNTANEITGNDEWVAEIIWDDKSQSTSPSDLIEFCDEKGNVSTSFTGKGIMPISFKTKGKEGNVLIGVRKPGSKDYLWSWHLWITSYDPEAEWATYPRNETKDIYMDRNLGALTDDMSDLENTYGLYYQFGRKDPIPRTSIAGYDCQVYFKEPQPYVNSVYKPNWFVYTGSESTHNWATDCVVENREWNNPEWNVSKAKSFFDPSPSGWHVPTEAELSDLDKATHIDNNDWKYTYLSEDTNKKFGLPYTGGHSYNSIEGSEEDKSNNNGEGLHYVGSRTYLWSGTPDGENSSNANYLCIFRGEQVRWSDAAKAYGLSVRCVRDKK